MFINFSCDCKNKITYRMFIKKDPKDIMDVRKNLKTGICW